MECLEGRSLLTATSAVAWTTGPVTHHALYAIAQNDSVEVSVDGGSFTNLGGYAKEISAGLDGSGNPEVFAIGLNDGLWVNHGLGWVSLGGYVTEVSAPAVDVGFSGNLAYAVGNGHGGFLHTGTSFIALGGTIE